MSKGQGPKKNRIVRWTGSPPDYCDLCERHIINAFVDAKTKAGPWGVLCLECHAEEGVGFGIGRGALYRKVRVPILQKYEWRKAEPKEDVRRGA